MPRPGPRRAGIGLRLDGPGRTVIQALADIETNGNISEMIRTLINEAVAARLQPGQGERALKRHHPGEGPDATGRP
jgi:hypothetical protein